jgi:hypothetical protein
MKLNVRIGAFLLGGAALLAGSLANQLARRLG